MVVSNIKLVVKDAPMDEKAGIKVVKITGDSDISVFAAEVMAKTELKPHYHSKGVEIYQVFEGHGIMKVGTKTPNGVDWDISLEVSTGDSFTIEEGKVHQIINNSKKPLIMLFTCREEHLSTDRTFI